MTPEAPSDPEVRTVALSRGPLAWTTEGDGPVVVAVHGLPGSVRDYRWLGSALAGRVRLVRLDLPGFGDTPLATRRRRRLADRAAVVAEALVALDLRDVIVLGHSFGGPVATAVAVASPRVAGLALLASVGLTPHVGLRRIGAAVHLAPLFGLPGVRRLVLPGLRRAYTAAGFPTSTPDEVLVHTFRTLAATSLAAHARNVAALRVPTLVAWTDDDPLVEREVSEALAARCPVGPRIAFADGGHNLQKTRAVELADALAAWAGQVGG